MAKKRGLFEEAEGGTLFLDEIGDLNISLQSKLLRVLQVKKIRAVGENVTKDVDVRILAATHKNLREAIRAGTFREDLFYRLSIIPVSLPPLRDRQEDIPVLAEHFLRRAAALNQSPAREISPTAMERLMGARWEGNVRELENVIERVVVLARSAVIDVVDLPEFEIASAGASAPKSIISDWPSLPELEKRYMRLVLDKVEGRKELASVILGINRRTLYRKEREFGGVQEDKGAESAADDSQDETQAEYDT